MNDLSIVTINDIRCWGGKEKIITELSALFTQLGVRVSVIQIQNSCTIRTTYHQLISYFRGHNGKLKNFRIITIPARKLFWFIYPNSKFFKILEKSKVIYFTDLIDLLRLLPLNKILNILSSRRTIIGLHSAYLGYLYRDSHKFYADLRHDFGKKFYSRYLVFRDKLRKNVLIHAINDEQYKILKLEGFRTILLPNGVFIRKNSIRFNKLYSDSTRNNKDVFRIIWFGRHIFDKGIDVLLQTIFEICKKESLNKTMEFFILGRGPLSYIVERNIYKLRKYYDCNIIYKGFVNEQELYMYLENSHVYLSTSRKECMPRTVIESLVHGLPVILSDISGHVFIAKYMGKEFISLTKLDPHFITKHILKYYQLYTNDSENYIVFKELLGKRAQRLFNWKHLLSRYLQMFGLI